MPVEPGGCIPPLTGTDPVQRGVTPGAIVPTRVSLLTGQLRTADGAALVGARVEVRNHLELGTTLSRADGRFDLVVNGGGPLTLRLTKEGFLPFQRRLTPLWQRTRALEAIVLRPLDPASTPIDFSEAIQVALGSLSSDADGDRQATLLFPEGTTAWLERADGSSEPLVSLTVRATEYTVGEAGPAAMPGDLPAASAYTYALELSVDEASSGTGAGTGEEATVHFSQPIPFYVENFLGFPTGLDVPVGYYAPAQAAWVPAQSGRIVAVLEVVGNRAILDVEGMGQVASEEALEALGIDEAELATLASLYRPGQSLWRVQLDHFSSWDCNLGYGLPEDAVASEQGGPDGNLPLCDACQKSASISDTAAEPGGGADDRGGHG